MSKLMANTKNDDPPKEIAKRAWRKPEFKKLGRLQDIVHQGGGKLTATGGDPGENRKQSGSG